MTHFSRLFCSTALGAVLLPGFASADVTADDVWQNMQDYMATLGGEFTVATSRSSDTLSVSESSLEYQLPFGVGQISLDFSGFDLTEIGDGTVSVAYVEPTTYGIAVSITDEGSFSGKVDFDFEGPKMIASGAPGDVTYTWSMDGMTMRARDIEIVEAKSTGDAPKDVAVKVVGEFADLSGVTQVQVAEHVTSQSSYLFGQHEIKIDVQADEGELVHVAGGQSVDAQTALTLPRDGMDIMNLAAALRDGLAFASDSKTVGYYTSQITKENGVEVGNQISQSREQSSQVSLDHSGLQARGAVSEALVEMQPGAELPFLLKLRMAHGEGGMKLPLSASDDMQDISYDFALEGVTLSDQMWDLFDPQQTLPREPMVVEMDLAARILNKANWLDFMAVKAGFDAGEVPVELHEMTLNSLNVDMAGAKLIGSGSATFDNTDLESFNGFPRPTGAIDLAITGANGLLDNLVAMGLMTDEDAMGARMGAAVFTKPDPDGGEDALTSRIEMTDEGHILANGQRIQ